VVDRPALGARDDDVVDDAAEEMVRPAVEQQKPAAGLQHPVQLADHRLLVRVVVERVRARDHVERVRVEGQVFAVSHDQADASRVAVEFVLGAADHRLAQVEADDVPPSVGESAGQFARAAPDVQHAA